MNGFIDVYCHLSELLLFRNTHIRANTYYSKPLSTFLNNHSHKPVPTLAMNHSMTQPLLLPFTSAGQEASSGGLDLSFALGGYAPAPWHRRRTAVDQRAIKGGVVTSSTSGGTSSY